MASVSSSAFAWHPLQHKLAVLADAAKYDASCASSGAAARSSRGGAGMGATAPLGVCHSFTPDGRCVALLKLLLTNFCVYDCLYCINRASSDVPRARFSVAEVVQLTLDFYRRNCIEGLFLSSGVIQNPDYTMEQLIAVVRSLREQHHFGGYIHLKTIPDCDPLLLARAGLYADRLSINIELPTSQGLARLAPQKRLASIEQTMQRTWQHISEAQQARLEYRRSGTRLLPGRCRLAAPPRYATGGQSTQMMVGADTASDADILATSARLYGNYGLKRVYYSAFSPIPHASSFLQPVAPPLAREYRLYQADWLIRRYGFALNEIIEGLPGGMLALEMDPKLAWALAHRQWFPVDLQSAPRELLLRIPGLGERSVQRLLVARRVRTLRLDDLQRMKLPMNKISPFILVSDHQPGRLLDSPDLAARLLRPSPLLQRQQQLQGLAASVSQPAAAPGNRAPRRKAAAHAHGTGAASAQLELFDTASSADASCAGTGADLPLVERVT